MGLRRVGDSPVSRWPGSNDYEFLGSGDQHAQIRFIVACLVSSSTVRIPLLATRGIAYRVLFLVRVSHITLVRDVEADLV